MKIRNLILLLFLAVSKIGLAQQPCWQLTSGVNPGSAGVQVLNFSKTANIGQINVGTKAWLNFQLYNASGNTTCDLPAGTFQVEVGIPVYPGGVKRIIYDTTVTSWDSDFFTWTYDAAEDVIVGINRLPLQGFLNSIDNVYIPIKGNSVGFVQSTLNILALGGAANLIADDAHLFNVAVLVPTGGLPLTILGLEGSSQNCAAIAKWSTSNEVSLSRFDIEASIDGTKFEKVGTVKAGTTSNANSYQFSWKQNGDKVFYRLKIVDKDETFTYSKITQIVMDCNTVKSVKVFPNPAIINKQLNINLTGYQATAKGDLLSATGQLVKTIVLRNGANSIFVDNVAQGFYTLRITEAGVQTEVIKIHVLK